MSDPGATRMTCKDAIDILGDFLEELLSSDAVSALEAHLRGCEPCRAYLHTYRKTRELVGRAGQTEMPPELKERLRQFLLSRLDGRA